MTEIFHEFGADVILEYSENGKPQKKVFKNCFLTAWILGMCARLGEQNITLVKNIDGVNRTLNGVLADSSDFYAMTHSDITTLTGIQVGTGGSAVLLTDFQLQTRIIRGVLPGQILYSHNQSSNLQAISSEASYMISREFTNYSGGAITIKEIGLVLILRAVGAPTSDNFLVDRTHVDDIVIPSGESLYVTYKIRNRI